ncbi:MAG: OmpA family protein [bacterium]|nr:OmpA family protein [bacterium]
MIKTYLSILLFSVSFHAFAQNNCQFDSDGNCIAKGKVKQVTHKTTYGGKYITSVRIGLWQLFSIDGVKKAEGNYEYANEFSTKNGEWSFYSDASVLLFKRWYVNGMVQKTQFLDSGLFAHDNDTIRIVADSMGNLNVVEKKGLLKYQYSTTPKQLLNGDPGVFSKAEKTDPLAEENIRLTDDEFLQANPIVNSAIKIKRWAVGNPLNLINNPDFEMSESRTPNGHNAQIKFEDDPYAKYWGSANETPDIFHNKNNCYAGYRVYGVNYEVLRNELKAPLKAGVTYNMQFKLKLKFENTFAVNGVGVTLSKGLMVFKYARDAIKNGVVLETHKNLPLGCRDQWMVISGSFVATGGERYLYIGNFTPDSALKLTPVDKSSDRYPDEIYYYIDDVVLMEQTEGVEWPCNVKGCELKYDLKDTAEEIEPIAPVNTFYTSPQVGQTLVLRNIQFETDKWELLEGSFETLDSLVGLMRTYPTMVVEISGHTDNKGTVKNNETLSVNRAFAVVTYLMDLGIEEDRLNYKGMGQKAPIDSNATEAGRLNNRRVEFKIISL